MLSGLKFIPRDQLDQTHDDDDEEDKSNARKSYYKKKSKSHHNSSDDESHSQRIKKRSKKKWYSSQEDDNTQSGSSDEEEDTKRHRKRKHKKSKIKKSRRREYSSSHDDDSDKLVVEKGRKKGKGRLDESEADANDENIARKEMGLEWMLRPKEKPPLPASDLLQQTPTKDKEIKKVNPRELNPYLKNEGSGYPEEEEADGERNMVSSCVVGDGGASWRLKALKRAQEQAAREGKNLDEVVGERWGSLGKLAVSVASASAAPSHAHLHAIKNRIRRHTQDDLNESERDNKKGGTPAKMRVPRPDDSLSWGKRKSQSMSVVKDAGVISSALSSLQKFTNDGSFINNFKSQSQQQNESTSTYTDGDKRVEEDIKPAMSANQLAAKAMQLRMKGKHQEAQQLLKEAEVHERKSNPEGDVTTSRYIMHGLEKKREEDADMHVVRSIMQNKQYTSSISGQADKEYEYDFADEGEGEGPNNRKKKGKGGDKSMVGFEKRILTQQERCNFCFENPKRPRHLVVAIANFTYLMLPQWQPVVPGHCCILPMQHELATRSVDENVWDEIRNFKKCLLMMFAKQERDVVFLETVMGLAKQRKHCLVECIPLPPQVAKQAPLYFKKAIDEAEEEWSQHNAKKLIDTSEKGLRHSIPQDFPYFYVEFGLKKGFVHVIDDESQFKASFGLNVIRGMLRLPAHRRHKHDSIDTQKEAVTTFAREWDPFDWTKQLD